MDYWFDGCEATLGPGQKPVPRRQRKSKQLATGSTIYMYTGDSSGVHLLVCISVVLLVDLLYQYVYCTAVRTDLSRLSRESAVIAMCSRRSQHPQTQVAPKRS